jgi:predicted O-methyltransferase YrrM
MRQKRAWRPPVDRLKMRVGYTVRASSNMLRHPVEGFVRVGGRLDRRRDRRRWEKLDVPATDLYQAVPDCEPHLHAILGAAWPCEEAIEFTQVWQSVVECMATGGHRVGRANYGGWDDGDRRFAEAVSCLIAHLRPTVVVETGVAHGLTSRIILEGLRRNHSGRLWSIDLPAVDPTLHRQIGAAVPERLRSRWTYVEGSSRKRLPGLLAELETLDVFVHDSLHTGRNVRFELGAAWSRLGSGGAVVVDDVDHSLGFQDFIEMARPAAWFVTTHADGRGLWGIALKG